MHVPDSLLDLEDLGIIDRIVRPLMAGKEAQVYLVYQGEHLRVAKVYKEARDRSFRQLATYTEGRRTRNSRNQRAMNRKSRFGKTQVQEAWKSAEVDAIYRLSAAGVRVPEPFDFVDGVLVMELIADAHGEPAPRLVDVQLEPDEARDVFQSLIRDVVRMLCAGLVHGDLSDFNVLMGPEGPVIIDFPQAVEAAANNNARRLLLRDVKNLQHFLGRFAPELRKKQYGPEIWALYEQGKLFPDTPLTGRYRRPKGKADTDSVLREIGAAEKEERARREREGLAPLPEKKVSKYAAKKAAARAEAAKRAPAPTPLKPGEQPPSKNKKKRRRRKKKKPSTDPLDAFLKIGP